MRLDPNSNGVVSNLHGFEEFSTISVAVFKVIVREWRRICEEGHVIEVVLADKQSDWFPTLLEVGFVEKGTHRNLNSGRLLTRLMLYK